MQRIDLAGTVGAVRDAAPVAAAPVNNLCVASLIAACAAGHAIAGFSSLRGRLPDGAGAVATARKPDP